VKYQQLSNDWQAIYDRTMGRLRVAIRPRARPGCCAWSSAEASSLDELDLIEERLAQRQALV
jgi:hypothetical protein